jgi:hypothetical protein
VIGLGAVLGLAIGIVVSVATDLPLAREAGLALGALVGWLSRSQSPLGSAAPAGLAYWV